MNTISQIGALVCAYAPRLDLEEQLKFSSFIYNQFRDEPNLDDLNLANEWRNYKREEDN